MTSSAIEEHRLGRTDLTIPSLVFGTMARSHSQPAERRAIFRHALHKGLNVFDTAPLYGLGDTEHQLGEVLAEFPETQTTVLTKVGLNWRGEGHGPVHFETTDHHGTTRVVRRDSRPEAVRRDVEESLKRLGRECLDLVQVHFRDTDTPISETMQALVDLRAQGKVQEIGVCNFTLDEIRTAASALGDVPLASVQIRLNLLQRGPLEATDIVPWCQENGVGVLAYSPLAEGRLARSSEPAPGHRALNRALRELKATADTEETSMAALALGWLVNQPGVTGAVAGASTCTQLDTLLELNRMGREQVNDLTRQFQRARLLDPWDEPRWKQLLKRAARTLMS